LFDSYFSSDPAKAALAKALYSRSKTPLKVKPGVDRADHHNNNNDSYTSFFISVRYMFNKRSNYSIGYW